MTLFLLNFLAGMAILAIILFMIWAAEEVIFKSTEREYFKKHGKKLSTDFS